MSGYDLMGDFFYGCSIDLKGLVAQNQYNFIQPNSRASATNYVVLRYSDVDSLVSFCFCSIGFLGFDCWNIEHSFVSVCLEVKQISVMEVACSVDANHLFRFLIEV